MRPVAVLLFVLSLATLAIVLWEGSPRDARSAEIERGTPVGRPDEVQGISETRAAREAHSAPERNLSDSDAAPPNRAPVASEPVLAPSTLPGQILLSDDAGAPITGIEGKIQLLHFEEQRGHGVPSWVDVADGTFDVSVDGAEGFRVGELHLEGHVAIVDDETRWYPAEGSVVIHARLAALTRLNVRSARTGEHLDHVRILREGRRLGLFDRPSRLDQLRDAQEVVGDARSPIDLRAARHTRGYGGTVYFVGCPGFAWQAVRLDMSVAGERETYLEPSGDLEVTLVGEPAPEGTTLRLREEERTDGEPVTELPLTRSQNLEVLDLGEGAYLASIEWDAPDDTPHVLASAPVFVRAGVREQLMLRIAPQSAIVGAPLSGSLVLPASWGVTSFTLEATPETPAPEIDLERLRLSSSQLARTGRSDLWDFAFEGVPSGDCQIQFAGRTAQGALSATMQLSVPATGVSGVRFELPDAVRVTVHCRDAATEIPVEVDSCHWSRNEPSESSVHLSGWLNAGDADGTIELPVPEGKLTLFASSSDDSHTDAVVTVTRATRDVTLQLTRSCQLVIRFLDGDTPVPLTVAFWWPEPEPLDGEGRLLSTTIDGGSQFQCALSHPGRYRFEMPEFTDFQALPDQIISVQREHPTEHVVQLQRAQ